jgi:hypothetical protein
MKTDYYETLPSEDCLAFKFESVSETKTIKKIITFTRISGGSNFFNLAFGDVKKDTPMDDLIVSNNADLEKVLSTVLQSVVLFFKAYPKALLYIEGSTPVRTRLYRIVISKDLHEYQKGFNILGMIDEDVESFTRNRPYIAFVVTLKNRFHVW